jgi:carbonic anhydrase
MSTEQGVQRLLDGNRAWAQKCLSSAPEYFHDLASGQHPEYLWIGCSDSRVSADEITGTRPGEIFVHRNVANLVVHRDINLMAVLQYAVEFLEIKHVIVCGHYGCGGIEAALNKRGFGPIDDWLKNIRDVYRRYQREIDNLQDKQKRVHRLAELNVIEQAHNLCGNSIITQSWLRRGAPSVHGWIYSISDGVLKESIAIRNHLDIPRAFGRL